MKMEVRDIKITHIWPYIKLIDYDHTAEHVYKQFLNHTKMMEVENERTKAIIISYIKICLSNHRWKSKRSFVKDYPSKY